MTKEPNQVDRHVGSRVRMRRLMIGMSQEKLGEALGITFQQIQKYEKGTNRISASRLQQIANVLGVTISYLYEGLPAEDAGSSLAESSSPPYVSDFMGSQDGLQLMQAFTRIRSAKLRRTLVDHARALADEQEIGQNRGERSK